MLSLPLDHVDDVHYEGHGLNMVLHNAQTALFRILLMMQFQELSAWEQEWEQRDELVSVKGLGR